MNRFTLQDEQPSTSSLPQATEVSEGGGSSMEALYRAMADTRRQYGLPEADGPVPVVSMPWAVVSAPPPPAPPSSVPAYPLTMPTDPYQQLPPPHSASYYPYGGSNHSNSNNFNNPYDNSYNNYDDDDNQSVVSRMTTDSAISGRVQSYLPPPSDLGGEDPRYLYMGQRPPPEAPFRGMSTTSSQASVPAAAPTYVWPMPPPPPSPALAARTEPAPPPPAAAAAALFRVQPLRCVSLYDQAGSKALLMPVRPQSDALLFQRAFTHHQLNAAEIKSEEGGEWLKIKLSEKTWSSVHDSRLVLLDFCRAMMQQGGEPLCVSANLSRKTGPHAGTLFFRPPDPHHNNNNKNAYSPDPGMIEGDGDSIMVPEVACVSFPDASTVRFDQVPSHETRAIQELVQEFCQAYRLGSATRGASEIDIPSEILKAPGRVLGRVLISGMMQQMIQRGWSRCIPVHCMTHRKDPVHTLLFVKMISYSQQQQNQHNMSSGSSVISSASYHTARTTINVEEECVPTCCISLVEKNAISVFGLDDDKASEKVFVKAIKDGWSRGVTGPKKNGPVATMTCEGEPWRIHSKSSEAMAARRLICQLLEAMFRHGWSYYAAMTMSFLPDESSSFVLIKKKVNSTDAGSGAGQPSQNGSSSSNNCSVGCLHLFGANEMHFIKMPPLLLDHLVRLFDSRDRPWSMKSVPERPDTYTLVMHLRDNPWIGPAKSEFKAALAKCMISVLYEIERVGEGRVLCTANIADSDTHSPMGCDSFFFTFPPQG